VLSGRVGGFDTGNGNGRFERGAGLFSALATSRMEDDADEIQEY
jgi:hypothetical protein